MDNPAGPDKGLLDRLNALKPTTINLDAPSKSVPVSTKDSAKPVSREDALSERLKGLRNQPDTKPSIVTDAGLIRADRASPTPSSKAQLLAGRIPAGTGIGISRQATMPTTFSAVPGMNDVDPLLDTDDQTLEELLADLGSDEQWLEEVAAEVAQTKDEEHRRVTALLEELAKAPPLPELGSDIATSSSNRDTDDKEKSDGDDSDGEPMAREIDDVLAQAMDEVNLEKTSQSSPEQELEAQPPTSDETSDTFTPQNRAPAVAPGIAEDLGSNPLNLPSVPSGLQDRPDESPQYADFETEIASRMAALKGSGVYERYNYTDEDVETWCIVCHDDGAIRCFGCEDGKYEDGIYCAMCWREMHVGLRAGYDMRGHRWKKFVKNR